MKVFWAAFISLFTLVVHAAQDHSTEGITRLLERRLPNHVDDFEFSLTDPVRTPDNWTNDEFTVTSAEGKIHIQGNSLSGIIQGLHRYLSDVAHLDIFWYIGSRLDMAPEKLPTVSEPLKGSSSVPWRYHLNTVTFSYTAAFWTWEDWEFELDWMALRGINLPLAWVGYEKILVEVFREVGITDEEIHHFLSGPAYQAWNRFGNIHGSWGGDLPFEWIEGQFELQKKIIRRMVDLGMTPVLPCFAGFAPYGIYRVFPEATIVNATSWAGVSERFTRGAFLEPFNPEYAQMQESFLRKQAEAYGNITHFYTLDQYNEMNPLHKDTDFLRNVADKTLGSLKSFDPDGTWLMQGWLFMIAADFWTPERIQAYLSAGENFHDMLLLDLNAESNPIWSKTESFYGKAWIWCQVHDFGGNMNIYGQIQNITKGPVDAMEKSPNMVGVGNAMEGQEGNEVIYDLLLDQGWSSSVIDTKKYFHDWVTSRYSDGRAAGRDIPEEMYKAWEILRSTAYDNTDLTDWRIIPRVPRSILQQSPSINAHEKIRYDPADMVKVWNLMLKSALFAYPAFRYDMVDVTRQVLANAFVTTLPELQSKYKSGAPASEFMPIGHKLLLILRALDTVLLANENFRLSEWTSAARAWAGDDEDIAEYYAYNARNQITLWSARSGALDDYAAKMWGGLVSEYYYPRWKYFFEYLKDTPADEYADDKVREILTPFEENWVNGTNDDGNQARSQSVNTEDLQSVLKDLQENLGDVFSV